MLTAINLYLEITNMLFCLKIQNADITLLNQKDNMFNFTFLECDKMFKTKLFDVITYSIGISSRY